MAHDPPAAAQPANEPVLAYAPGSPERELIKRTLGQMRAQPVEIPLLVGGETVRTGHTAQIAEPHRHRAGLGRFHQAGPTEVHLAIEAARRSFTDWSRRPASERFQIFLRAAELARTKYRPILNAATMLGQSKTVHQAEIDAACETIDFWRWNVHFCERIHAEQPVSPPGVSNQLDARPLEGFVLAIAPFNFTAIAANLMTAPAMLGNTVVFKPASTAVLAAHFLVQVLREAGLPDGVINFVPGPASAFAQALSHPELAGIHFTGSTGVFQSICQTVGQQIAGYRNYPRLVGETGGKNFVVVHPSADLEVLATAIVRGGYEYQGQKCSAASRIYVPESIWPQLRDRLMALIEGIQVGDVTDFRNFMGAVIDRRAFERIQTYLALARQTPSLEILAGGKTKSEEGWFVEPTLVQSQDPKSRLMCEEIFGPIVTVHSNRDNTWSEMLRLVDETSIYGLTGAVFARDPLAVAQARAELRFCAGNFYINDKPTGAVVGQQPFGGARASGTNDKAGSLFNLLRWTSPRVIKENFNPPADYRYPFMEDA